jgi:peptidyl-prolyl cis-trans isomerase C
MSHPWERFGQRRLALTRWQCEPQAIPPDEREAFNQAWSRQRFMEQAIVTQAQELIVTPALTDTLGTSLSGLLNECGLTDEERQTVIHHHALMELQFARITEQVPSPDDLTVRAWYQQHQDKFIRPEQRLTHHLLLTVDENHDAMRRQSMRFYREIQTSRDAFARLAKRYSHCPSALEGGRLGWISRGLLYPELESALFALPENGLTPPVETELGWHLLWCENIRPAAPMAQEDALEKARDFIWKQHQQQWQQQWLARLLDRM